MADGNWIMAGTRLLGQTKPYRNPPAVAISRGDDLKTWDVVSIELGDTATGDDAAYAWRPPWWSTVMRSEMFITSFILCSTSTIVRPAASALLSTIGNLLYTWRKDRREQRDSDAAWARRQKEP